MTTSHATGAESNATGAESDATGTTEESTGAEVDRIRTDGGSRSTGVRAILIGETGFERATIWSAVGFALVVAAFIAIGPADTRTGGRAVAIVAVSLAALGTIGLARVGGGVGPCIVLPAGPVAGAVVGVIQPDAFRTVIGPEPVTASLAVAVGWSLVVAALVAVLVGVSGYGIGRVWRSAGSSRSLEDSDVAGDAGD